MFILLLACAEAEEEEYSRVVVTFRSVAYNTLEAVELLPQDITVVKQYGRCMDHSVLDHSVLVGWDNTTDSMNACAS